MTTGTLPRRPAAGRTHVERVMGTACSFDLRDPLPPGVFGRVLEWLHWVDRTFSTTDEGSWIRRLERGEVTIDECPPEVGLVLDLSEAMQVATEGYLSGPGVDRRELGDLVKAWAIERAARMLAAAGSRRHAVGTGGDVQAFGWLGADRPWRIGVGHPLEPQTLLAVVEGADFAVATATGGAGPAADLLAVTVTGPDLTRAHAFATAALAMGEGAYRWLRGLGGFSALVVDRDGCVWRTAGFPAVA